MFVNIEKIKNTLREFQAENGRKFKNTQAELIKAVSYIKKKCSMDNRGHVDLSHLRDLGWMHIPDRV